MLEEIYYTFVQYHLHKCSLGNQRSKAEAEKYLKKAHEPRAVSNDLVLKAKMEVRAAEANMILKLPEYERREQSAKESLKAHYSADSDKIY